MVYFILIFIHLLFDMDQGLGQDTEFTQGVKWAECCVYSPGAK